MTIKKGADPLEMDQIFARVLRVYTSRWRAVTSLACVAVIPMLYPRVLFQASLELLTSDPVVLFDLTIFSIPLSFGFFMFKFYHELKPSVLERPFIFVTVPWAVVWARDALFRAILDIYQKQEGFHLHSTTGPNTIRSSCSLLGAGIVLLVGEFLAATVVPILVGPDPLEMGWILSFGRIPTSLFITGSLFTLLKWVAPFLLVYPSILVEKLTMLQGFRRSWKLARQTHFEVWFSHLILIFLQVIVARCLRSLGLLLFAEDNQLWGQIFFQHLTSLVFLPLFIILQTDLYLHCRILNQESTSVHPQLKEATSKVPLWSVAEDDSSTDGDSGSSDSMHKVV